MKMWLWPDLVNLPCCCWSTLWQPRPLSDASLAWSWCPASKSDTTARTFCTDFAWIFQFFPQIFFFILSIDQFAFFCFSAQQKFWTLWLTNNGRLYPWKKAILFKAFGQGTTLISRSLYCDVIIWFQQFFCSLPLAFVWVYCISSRTGSLPCLHCSKLSTQKLSLSLFLPSLGPWKQRQRGH